MKPIKKIERFKDLKNLSRTCFGIGRLVFQSIICNLLIFNFFASQAFAVDVAPRISDKEIIESLANIRGDIKEVRAEIKRLEAGQAALQMQINGLQQQINDLKVSTQQQINDLRELIKWMVGILISISFTIMAIMGRILWNQQKKLVPLCI